MGHGDNLAGVDHAGPIRLRGLVRNIAPVDPGKPSVRRS